MYVGGSVKKFIPYIVIFLLFGILGTFGIAFFGEEFLYRAEVSFRVEDAHLNLRSVNAGVPRGVRERVRIKRYDDHPGKLYIEATYEDANQVEHFQYMVSVVEDRVLSLLTFHLPSENILKFLLERTNIKLKLLKESKLSEKAFFLDVLGRDKEAIEKLLEQQFDKDLFFSTSMINPKQVSLSYFISIVSLVLSISFSLFYFMLFAKGRGVD